MKKLIAICILAFLCINVTYTQGNVSNDMYTLKSEVVVTDYDFMNKSLRDESFILYDHVVFEEVDVIDIEGMPHVIVKPIKVLKSKTPKSIVDRDVTLFEYYVVSKFTIEPKKQKYTDINWDLRVGFSVIPLKVYPFQDGPLDFTASSISQGASIGLAHQVNRRKSNLWLVYSFSMNFTKVTPRKDDFLDDSFEGNDLAALSPAIGISLNYNNAEFGLFLGKDFLPGNAASAWKYNGDTWYSFTIGTSFSTSNN